MKFGIQIKIDENEWAAWGYFPADPEQRLMFDTIKEALEDIDGDVKHEAIKLDELRVECVDTNPLTAHVCNNNIEGRGFKEFHDRVAQVLGYGFAYIEEFSEGQISDMREAHKSGASPLNHACQIVRGATKIEPSPKASYDAES